ncbi:MAG: hypothetical protein SGPRY_013410 [Prymnesium sp.]
MHFVCSAQANEFDVVIVDSSDPVGPAETLFTSDFYRSLRHSMKPGAIMCNQGECIWLHLELIGDVLSHCKEVFPSVDYAFTTIPTYPSGQIGFLLCSTTPNVMLRSPLRAPEPELAAQLKYYSTSVHAAAFVLPQFAEKVVSKVGKLGCSWSDKKLTALSVFAGIRLLRLSWARHWDGRRRSHAQTVSQVVLYSV